MGNPIIWNALLKTTLGSMEVLGHTFRMQTRQGLRSNSGRFGMLASITLVRTLCASEIFERTTGGLSRVELKRKFDMKQATGAFVPNG